MREQSTKPKVGRAWEVAVKREEEVEEAKDMVEDGEG